MRGGRREVEHRRDARCVRRRGRCWRGVVPRMALRGRRWRSVVRPRGRGAVRPGQRRGAARPRGCCWRGAARCGGAADEIPRVRAAECRRRGAARPRGGRGAVGPRGAGGALRGRGSGEVLCGRWRDVTGAIAGCPGVVQAAERRRGRLRERGRLGGGRNVVGRWLEWRGCGSIRGVPPAFAKPSPSPAPLDVSRETFVPLSCDIATRRGICAVGEEKICNESAVGVLGMPRAEYARRQFRLRGREP